MIENTLNVRLLHAAKTAADWANVTATPKQGEVCLEIQPDDATATTLSYTPPYSYKIKIGDGTTSYANLPYFGTIVTASGTPQVASIYTYPNDYATEALRGVTVLRIYALSLSDSVDASTGETTVTIALGTSYKEIRPGSNISFTSSSSDAILTIASSMDFSSLDASAFALAEWHSADQEVVGDTDAIRIYKIKEVDGVISRDTNFLAIKVSSPLTISHSNGVITLGIQDGTTSQKGAVQLLDTYVATGDGANNTNNTKATTNKAIKAALETLDGNATTVDSTSDTKDVIVEVTETDGIISSKKKVLAAGNKISITAPTSGDDAGKIKITHSDVDSSGGTAITPAYPASPASDTLGFGDDVITGFTRDAQGHVVEATKKKLPSNPNTDKTIITNGLTGNDKVTVTGDRLADPASEINIKPTSGAAGSFTVSDGTNSFDVDINPVSAPGESSSGAGDSTAGQLMKSDGDNTTSPSGFTPSNSAITESGSGNTVTLPTIDAVITYVTSKLTASMVYKGTVSTEAGLPSSPSTGWVYIASAQIVADGTGVLPAGTYDAGDYFVYNGTGWDPIQGAVRVSNENATIGTSLTKLATVEGVEIKAKVNAASTTTAGIVQMVTDIHNSTDTDKVASAKQTWDEFEKRNVQFVEMESIETLIHSLSEQEFIDNYAYGVRWIQGESTCTRVGSQMAIDTMPVHNSFRACVYKINPVTNGFDVTETIDNTDYTIHYGARREFQYWLDDDDWSKKSDGTASVINGTGNTGVAIYHDRFYGKSFEGITYNGRSDYNAVYVSMVQYDDTWTEIKEGFVDFAKATISSGMARCYTGATPTVSTSRKAMHDAALASGGHMMSYDEYKWIFYWLPVIEFGTFQIESNTVPSTWSWGSDVVNRASLTGDDIPAYGYPMLYSGSTLGYNYITSGFTNALGTHTGWVKYTNAGYSANVLPVVRWRGFEIQRCNWTNVQGCWGEQTSSPDTIFATKNRALFSAYILSGNTEKHCIVNLDGSELANVTSAINNETWALDSTDNLWKSTTYKVRDQHIRYVGKQVGGGFIGEFTINSLGDMIPKTIADKKYDYSYTSASFSETYLHNPRCLRFGGGADSGSYGGPGCLRSDGVASLAYGLITFRVCWNIDEYTSVMN